MLRPGGPYSFNPPAGCNKECPMWQGHIGVLTGPVLQSSPDPSRAAWLFERLLSGLSVHLPLRGGSSPGIALWSASRRRLHLLRSASLTYDVLERSWRSLGERSWRVGTADILCPFPTQASSEFKRDGRGHYPPGARLQPRAGGAGDSKRGLREAGPGAEQRESAWFIRRQQVGYTR